jgi:hypothetical protein
MRLVLPCLAFVAVLVTAGASAIVGPKIICQGLPPAQCQAAIAAAIPAANGHAVDLVVAEGYYDCVPGAFCGPSRGPSGGWPLSAVVAMRFEDRSRPLVVDVRDVFASPPVTDPIGVPEGYAASILRPFESASPSPTRP